MVLIAHQFCFLQPEGKDLLQHLLVVVGIVVVAQAGVCLVDVLPQFTVLGILQERQAARLLQGEHPFAGQSACFSFVRRAGNDGLGQAGQVFLLVDDKLVGVVVSQDMVAEVDGQCGELFVDFAQALLLVCVERRTRTDEPFIVFVEQIVLFGVEAQRAVFLLLVQGGDALVEVGVQVDVVLMFGEHRGDASLQGYQAVVCVSFSEGEEDAAHACE